MQQAQREKTPCTAENQSLLEYIMAETSEESFSPILRLTSLKEANEVDWPRTVMWHILRSRP